MYTRQKREPHGPMAALQETAATCHAIIYDLLAFLAAASWARLSLSIPGDCDRYRADGGWPFRGDNGGWPFVGGGGGGFELGGGGEGFDGGCFLGSTFRHSL